MRMMLRKSETAAPNPKTVVNKPRTIHADGTVQIWPSKAAAMVATAGK